MTHQNSFCQGLKALVVVLHGLGELEELAEQVVGALKGDAQLARW
jgi:hypothetical protein